MRKMFAGFVATAFVVAAAAPAFAKTETVKGEVVELTCYMKDKKNMGASHKECADKCIKDGSPVGLVTADGKAYMITGGLAADKNAKLLAHVTHTVEITGDVTEKDGKMIIAVSSIKMAH